ncbi:MAG: sugar phosphate isomerase/epimerase [Armatimonadetes bacterium]|nr:sugar phosphate isomerase/epimerase [Armatimonadota bacterium]
MKFAVSSWVWISPLTTEKLEWLAPHVASLGFDGVELAIEGMEDIDYRRASELLQKHNLSPSVVLAMAGPSRDMLDPDPKNRESCAAYIRHCIDAAEIIGATRIVGPFYAAVGRLWQSPPERRKRELAHLKEQIPPLADYAAAHGVVMCVEPVNRYETSFINCAAQAIELVDLVNHPAFGMLLDTFHMNIEERSISEAVRAAGRRLKHVHVGENDRGAPGGGGIAWEEWAQALRDIDYDGTIVIESLTCELESIATAAAIWRPLAPTQDALAKDGLTFLRRLFAS